MADSILYLLMIIVGQPTAKSDCAKNTDDKQTLCSIFRLDVNSGAINCAPAGLPGTISRATHRCSKQPAFPRSVQRLNAHVPFRSCAQTYRLLKTYRDAGLGSCHQEDQRERGDTCLGLLLHALRLDDRAYDAAFFFWVQL